MTSDTAGYTYSSPTLGCNLMSSPDRTTVPVLPLTLSMGTLTVEEMTLSAEMAIPLPAVSLSCLPARPVVKASVVASGDTAAVISAVTSALLA